MDNYDIAVRSISYRCGVPYVEKPYRDDFWKKENKITMKYPSVISSCEKVMDDLVNDKIISQADTIFISMKWEPHSLPKINTAIRKISRLTNAKVYLFGNKILSKSSVDIVSVLGRVNGIKEYASGIRDETSDAVNKKLMNVHGVEFVDMMKLTCPSVNSCNVLTDDFKPIFFDAAHLTQDGAAYLGKSFTSILPSSPKSKPNG